MSKIIMRGAKKVGDWAIGSDGQIGHICINHTDPYYHQTEVYSKTVDIFSPITGVKQKFCMSCEVVVPKSIDMLAKLQKIGKKGKGPHKYSLRDPITGY